MNEFTVTFKTGLPITVFAKDITSLIYCVREKYPEGRITNVSDKGVSVDKFFALPDFGGLVSLPDLIKLVENDSKAHT